MGEGEGGWGLICEFVLEGEVLCETVLAQFGEVLPPKASLLNEELVLARGVDEVAALLGMGAVAGLGEGEVIGSVADGMGFTTDDEARVWMSSNVGQTLLIHNKNNLLSPSHHRPSIPSLTHSHWPYDDNKF